jgi:rhomboid protease GluP
MAKCAQCGRNVPGFGFGKRLCPWCVQHQAAQRGDDSEYQRVMPSPWRRSDPLPFTITQVFAGICAAVFLGMTLSGVSLTQPQPIQLVHWGANYGPYTFGGEWWRLLTYMFVHIGIIHIAFNMWCLWDLGALAESLYGHWTFGAIYLVSGLAGGLASGWWHATPVPSAGASGAIFGIAGALIASYKLGEFSLPRGAIQAPLRSLMAFVGYNIVFGLISGFTDNACHVGGLLAGALLGALIAVAAPTADAVFKRIVILLAVVGLIAAGTAHVSHLRGYNVYAQRGGELLGDGNLDEATAQLQKAVQKQPDKIQLRFALAKAYLMKSQFPQARDEFQRVLALDPRSEDALHGLAYCFYAEKQFPQARDVYSRLLALDTNSAIAHSGLGMVDGAEGKYADAVREYSASAALNPSQQGIYYNLGQAYAGLKQFDSAIAAYQKEQELSGDDPAIEHALAEAYRAKGMSKEAADAESKAAQKK